MTTEQLKSNITFSIATIKALQALGLLKLSDKSSTLSFISSLMVTATSTANYTPEIYADSAKGNEKIFQLMSEGQRRFSRDTKPVVDDIAEIITKHFPSLVKETE